MIHRYTMTAALLTAVACGGSSPTGTSDAAMSAPMPDLAGCPNDLPAACPSPAPSYQSAVAAVFSDKCGSCHSPGGQSADRPLQTYAEVFALRTSVLTQVYGCAMPPSGAPPLTPSERAAILGWLVCGSPQN